ncbi:MAG: GtrA family protein [Burkholderiales bacterium]|nr:GtrA family protein [Burkholderiales bacterium]
MQAIIKLFTKYKGLRFLFTGGLNTIICLILFAILINVGLNYLLASTMVFIFGVIEGYLLSAVLVFRHKIKFRPLLRYSLVYIASYIVNIMILYTCVEFIHLSKVNGQIVTSLLIAALNYALVKKLVFKIN